MAKEKEVIDEKAPETKVPETKKTVLISAAEKWDFEAEPIFTGIYHSPHVAKKNGPEKDGKPQWLEGDILGFNFMDESEELYIIGNSHSIEEVLGMDYKGKKVIACGFPLEIEYKGKGTKSDGQQFNRFKISVIE